MENPQPGFSLARMGWAGTGRSLGTIHNREALMVDTATHPHRRPLPSLQDATAGDVMHRGIVSCDTRTTLTDVARIMASHRVHCVAVMEPSHDHSGNSYVWGIISDLDLIQAGIRLGLDESAGTLAHQQVISVRPDMSLREAGELMIKRGVSHLVVIDAETQLPMGVLSPLDIAEVLAWGEA